MIDLCVCFNILFYMIIILTLIYSFPQYTVTYNNCNSLWPYYIVIHFSITKVINYGHILMFNMKYV